MSIVEGKVVNGHVEVDFLLPEGSRVSVYVPDEHDVELTADEAAMLDDSISEADADPTGGVPWDEFRRALHSGS